MLKSKHPTRICSETKVLRRIATTLVTTSLIMTPLQVKAQSEAKQQASAGGDLHAPEVSDGLLSDQPIPSPISLPLSVSKTPDARKSYLEWVRAAQTLQLVVRVRELVPTTGGSLAHVDILRSSDRDVPRNVFLFPHGVSCQGIDPQIGETVLIHVSRSHITDPNATVVPIIAPLANPIISHVTQTTEGSYSVSLPWGNDSFDALLKE